MLLEIAFDTWLGLDDENNTRMRMKSLRSKNEFAINVEHEAPTLEL